MGAYQSKKSVKPPIAETYGDSSQGKEETAEDAVRDCGTSSKLGDICTNVKCTFKIKMGLETKPLGIHPHVCSEIPGLNTNIRSQNIPIRRLSSRRMSDCTPSPHHKITFDGIAKSSSCDTIPSLVNMSLKKGTSKKFSSLGNVNARKSKMSWLSKVHLSKMDEKEEVQRLNELNERLNPSQRLVSKSIHINHVMSNEDLINDCEDIWINNEEKKKENYLKENAGTYVIQNNYKNTNGKIQNIRDNDNYNFKGDNNRRNKNMQYDIERIEDEKLDKDANNGDYNNQMWLRNLNQNLFLPSYPVDYNKANNFQVCRWLGCGSFSQVYQVKTNTTGENFALKKIKKAYIIRQKLCFQVQEEIDILLKIRNHQFILGIVSCWQTKGYLLQLLPYTPHGDLNLLWRKEKKFPLSCVARVTAEIANALEYIHSNGIIYRDLKMENILISTTGHTLLSDFGLSKTMGKLARTYTVCGTLDYVAPEVTTGNGYSYQCDWWSLGVVTVAMAIGHMPFQPAKHHKEMGQMIKQGLFVLPKMTDNPIIKEIIYKLLSYQSLDRLCTLKELQQLQLYSKINVFELSNTEDGPLRRYFFIND